MAVRMFDELAILTLVGTTAMATHPRSSMPRQNQRVPQEAGATFSRSLSLRAVKLNAPFSSEGSADHHDGIANVSPIRFDAHW